MQRPHLDNTSTREGDEAASRRRAAIKTTVIVVIFVVVTATIAWLLTERLIESGLR